jgi:hypothetical protein
MKQTPNQASKVELVPWQQWLPTVQLEWSKDKGNTGQKTIPFLYPPLIQHGSATLITALVKRVGGSSVPVQSCYLPMQSCHMDEPPGIFPESHLPRVSLRRPCLYTSRLLPNLALVRRDSDSAHSSRGQTVSLGWLLSPLDKAKGTRSSPWLDLCGRMRECAGSKASSLQNHWAYFSVVLGFTSPILVHCFFFFSPFLGFKIFCSFS